MDKPQTLGIGATYPNAFGAPVFPYGLLRLTAACAYASPTPPSEGRGLGQRLKLAVFGHLRQLRLLLMAAARDIRLKPKLYFSQKNLFQLKSDNSQIDTKSPNYVNI